MFAAQPPAKLNLTLEVGPRGDDGYHPLRSVFLRIGLADRLRVAPATEADRDRLDVAGLPGCPVEGNLVLRAFELLRDAVGQPLPPLAAQLEKRIPIGAGLAGGSSDAAAALDLAAACWGVGLSPRERARLAMALGSDVAFFVADCPAALVEGRGERVTVLPGFADDAGVLLAVFDEPLSTAAVFARLDKRAASGLSAAADKADRSVTDDLAAALAAGLAGDAVDRWLGRLAGANDLWPAAAELVPSLVPARRALEAATSRPWLMTGSGTTLFTLYSSPGAAEVAGRRLARRSTGVEFAFSLLATGTDVASPSWRE
ncbi:MAG: 4-(cytidine 5'-diphospho)-2-C-methyl-D-erythritol kinase [Chloroflexota bacterium]|nr:4-(cytidine 5'-diphospho)-2-C-methyl-D-erythritol kinase [Chloroflexota bacterium]